MLIWVARYRKYGIQGLELRSSKYDYDGEFKLKVLNRKKHTKLHIHKQHFNLTLVILEQSLIGKERLKNVALSPCLPEVDGQLI